jgi:hypothetical protein
MPPPLSSRASGVTSCSRPGVAPARRAQAPWRRGRAVSAARADGDGDADTQPDLVTSLFGRLFGQKALDDPRPGGLKRLKGTALAAQYPATTTEFAAPVPGDSPGAASIRPLLKDTPLEAAPLAVAYDASRDGWSVDAFLAGVATRGASVLVATTAGGAVCGGYAPRSWLGLGEEKSAASAFLFRFDPARPGDGLSAAKLPKVGGPGLALIDRPGEGPRWGAEDFRIVFDREGGRDVPAQARSRLGTGYARLPSGGGRSLFAEDEGGRAELTGLVMYVADGEPESWELDGVVWKSK